MRKMKKRRENGVLTRWWWWRRKTAEQCSGVRRGQRWTGMMESERVMIRMMMMMMGHGGKRSMDRTKRKAHWMTDSAGGRVIG